MTRASFNKRTIHLADAEQTRAAGFALGQVLLRHRYSQPFIIALSGELGAGKTTLVGGLLAAMGHAGAVRSPTYTLIEPYDFKHENSLLAVFHLDLYRLTDSSQLEELGIRDLLRPDALLLIEWAERAESKLPRADLAINLSYVAAGTNGRELVLVSNSEVSNNLLHSMHI